MHRPTLPASLLLTALLAAPALAQQAISTSILRPSALDADSGVIAGPLPGGEGARTFYVAADLKAGDLLAQLSVTGRANSHKRLTLELLGPDARARHSHYVLAGLEATGETTRAYPVDATGRHILRIIVEGKETGTFCVLLGGAALPSAKPAGCPGQEAPPQREAGAALPVVATPPAPPPPARSEPPPKVVEVIEQRCEQRLRIGSDLLFDFDRADIRPDASRALDIVARMVAERMKPVTIEGHTDAKGTDSYNQTLSERRARSVENDLRHRVLGLPPMSVRGFGKSRPVAPNQQPDGSDDPDGRQKNRRVEVVIDTCA
jgi:outer membrane protein OmpA-like peptidoglycan-associated protein